MISILYYKITSAKDIAFLFLQHVYRYYRPPETIVLDYSSYFISQFWNKVYSILGIKLKLSTSYYPQTDGQTEIINQYLVQKLYIFINYNQDDQLDLLPIIDFALSLTPNRSIGLSLFIVYYGYKPCVSFDWKERYVRI